MAILSFKYETETIEFEVEYRNRKTFEVRIEPPSSIKVKAPRFSTEEDIIRIVRSKSKWIMRKLFELKDMEYVDRKKEYIDGESFMYLGRNYPLQIVDNVDIKVPQTKLYQGKFYIDTNTREKYRLKHCMEQWYRIKTMEKVLGKIEYYKDYIGFEPRIVKVKDQKKRWGSCTSNKDIIFNFRCSMAPSNVMDYIVVHEMCHLVHLNHSKDFWNLVKMIMPDYKERKEWLRNYGVRMSL